MNNSVVLGPQLGDAGGRRNKRLRRRNHTCPASLLIKELSTFCVCLRRSANDQELDTKKRDRSAGYLDRGGRSRS